MGYHQDGFYLGLLVLLKMGISDVDLRSMLLRLKSVYPEKRKITKWNPNIVGQWAQPGIGKNLCQYLPVGYDGYTH